MNEYKEYRSRIYRDLSGLLQSTFTRNSHTGILIGPIQAFSAGQILRYGNIVCVCVVVYLCIGVNVCWGRQAYNLSAALLSLPFRCFSFFLFSDFVLFSRILYNYCFFSLVYRPIIKHANSLSTKWNRLLMHCSTAHKDFSTRNGKIRKKISRTAKFEVCSIDIYNLVAVQISE